MYDDEFRTVETTTRRVSGQMTKPNGHMAVFRYLEVEHTNPFEDVTYWDMVPLGRSNPPGTREVF